MSAPSVTVQSVSHIGIRVLDADRAAAFYQKLGFTERWRGGPEPVVILRNDAHVEINLIVNAAADFDGTNVLMDEGPKRAGYTHVALAVASIDETVAQLAALGIPLSGGPVRLGPGVSLFIRDPDRNVVELRAEDRA